MRELRSITSSKQLMGYIPSHTSNGIAGIDLRAEIDALLEEFGFYVLLVRTNQKVHCSCWDHIYHSAKPDCPYCAGTGFVTVIEKHKTMQSRHGGTLKMESDNIFVDDRVSFYFRYNVAPVTNDIVYVVGWVGETPSGVISAYTIDSSLSYRGDNGRIEYYECVCENHPVNVSIRSVNMRRLRDLIDSSYLATYVQYDLLFE